MCSFAALRRHPLYRPACPPARPPRRYYALLAERFAKLKREYADAFSEAFVAQYQLIHRLETNKLRNTAKLFAHLLATDAIPWAVLQVGWVGEGACRPGRTAALGAPPPCDALQGDSAAIVCWAVCCSGACGIGGGDRPRDAGASHGQAPLFITPPNTPCR